MSRNEPFTYPAARRAAATSALALTLTLASLSFAVQATAGEAPQSKHQMMKDCMTKQKASESGRLKEDMKKSCRDLTGTEKQNADKAAAPEAQAPQK